MKIAVVIPLYKQAKYWKRMVEALEKQTIKPDIVIAIVDRPIEDEWFGEQDGYSYIKSVASTSKLQISVGMIGLPPNIPRHMEGQEPFIAGYARNMGCDIAQVEYGADCVIFIDGDCIPQAKLVEAHMHACECQEPVLCVARRREEKYRWQDQRETLPNLISLGLFEGKGTLINNPKLLEDCLIVWSCNLSLNGRAIDRIRKLNELYYGRREVFNSNFLGAWGGEDSFLGIQAWVARVFITTLAEQRAGVQHIDHPRPTSVYTVDHKVFFEDELNKMRTKLRLNPITLDFFT